LGPKTAPARKSIMPIRGSTTGPRLDAWKMPSGPFPLGVASGDPTKDSVQLWTYAPNAKTLRITVREEGSSGAPAAFEQRLPAASDGYTQVSVKGLKPGTRYQFVFETSLPGHFSTAPDENSLEPVVFGAVSCTNRRVQPIKAMSEAAVQNADFFIHGGDASYNDDAKTLDEYNKEWAQTWSIDEVMRFRSAHGVFSTWDDHEIANDWSSESVDPGQLRDGIASFYKNTPVQPEATHLWRKFRWGKGAEVFMIDSRSERKPSTRKTPEAIYLSPEQMAWLKEGLKSSTAEFKFIVNSVPIGDFPMVFDKKIEDRWEGYPAQRRELLDFIHKNKLEGVWFISGDFHMAAVGRVGPAGSPDAKLPEVLVGPGSSRSPNHLAYYLQRLKQWDFGTSQFNFGMFRVDPKTKTLEVALIDGGGKSLFRQKYNQAGETV
jgi:alkaline phosphatase D